MQHPPRRTGATYQRKIIGSSLTGLPRTYRLVRPKPWTKRSMTAIKRIIA